jgi:L-alanine-DL-glutamate epimerase-like enolase superfamily enzyme
LPPSLRFALEGLETLAKPGPQRVRSNAVLRWEGSAETRAQVESARRAGYGVCKIKIGPGDWAPLLDLLETAADLRFRLDANLSLDENSLAGLARGLESRALLNRVEYLEEPFQGAWQRESLRGLPLPLAADESAPDLAAAERLLEAPNPPAVFIVKPTVAGGLQSLDAPLARLRKTGRKVVITSALETEPGRRALLAHLSRGNAETSGLSTGHLFRDNFLADQAEWTSVPPPSELESRALAELAWKDCR